MLENRRRTLGEQHPETLANMNNLANVYLRQDRYGEAEDLHLKTLAGHRDLHGGEHPNTLMSMHNVATVYSKQGRYDEAEALQRAALKSRRRVLGDDHPDTLMSLSKLAIVKALQDRRGEALDLLRQAVDLGWRDARTLEDPDLAALHGEPRFEAIVAEVQAIDRQDGKQIAAVSSPDDDAQG